ncbi:hypothetical protein BSKO_13375 [Bryopsis sp. KO-2023]|nr:hypothetical protein BSKO_13375 [Bryopsis sp. KO-2023]
MAVPFARKKKLLALHPQGAFYPPFHHCMSPPQTRPQPLGVLLSSSIVVAVGGTFNVLVFLTYRLPFILAGAVVGTLVGCHRVAKVEILEPLACCFHEMAPLIEEVSDSALAKTECHRKPQQLRGVFRRCIFFLRSGARLLAKLLNCAVQLDVTVSWKALLGTAPNGAQDFCCEKDRIYIVPIVLLGDSGIGKSTLIHRLTKNDPPSKTAPTSIVDFHRHRMVIDGAIIEVQVWEVGGHLGFIALGPKFFQSMEGCLLIHNCDGREAVKSLSSWKRTFEGMAGLRIPHAFPMAVLLPEGRAPYQKVKTKRFETVQDWATTKCCPAFQMHSMDDIEAAEIAMEFLVRQALQRRADLCNIAKPLKCDSLPIGCSAEQAV